MEAIPVLAQFQNALAFLRIQRSPERNERQLRLAPFLTLILVVRAARRIQLSLALVAGVRFGFLTTLVLAVTSTAGSMITSVATTASSTGGSITVVLMSLLSVCVGFPVT